MRIRMNGTPWRRKEKEGKQKKREWCRADSGAERAQTRDDFTHFSDSVEKYFFGDASKTSDIMTVFGCFLHKGCQ